MPDEEHALLTESQRDFLSLSEAEREEAYSKQQRYYHRRNIERRVRRGITDFSLLFEHLDDDLRGEIFDRDEYFGGAGMKDLDDLAEALNRGGRDELEEGIVDAIALFYMETSPDDRFEGLLSAGVNKAEKALRGARDLIPGFFIVTVAFDVSTTIRDNAAGAVERLKESGMSELSDEDRASIVWLLDHYGDIDALEDALERFKEGATALPDEETEE